MSQIDFIRKEVDVELVEMLKGDGLLTETQYIMMEGRSALTESRREPYHMMISNTPVSFDHFANVWNDIDNYQTPVEVYDALLGGHNIADESKTRQISKDRLFNQVSKMSSSESARLYNLIDYRSYSERKRAVDKLNKARADALASDNDPSSITPDTPERELEHNVDAGKRGRRSPTGNIEKLNNTDLFSGELYADVSRIPKRRWTQFFKIWQKRTQVRPNDRSIAQMLSGVRKWEKTFIFGYEIDRTLRYELWYNSYDGFFTLHDANGNEVARNIRNISEALSKMFEYVRQTSHEDADFLSRQTPELTRAQRAIRQDAERKKENAWEDSMGRSRKEMNQYQKDAERAEKEGEKAMGKSSGLGNIKKPSQKTDPVDNKNRRAFQNSKDEMEKVFGNIKDYETEWDKKASELQQKIKDDEEKQQEYKDTETVNHRQKLQNKSASEAQRELDLRDELFDINQKIDLRGSEATKKEKDRMEEIEKELKNIKKNRSQRASDRSTSRENRVNESDIFQQFKEFALEESTDLDGIMPEGAEISMGDAQDRLMSQESESQVMRVRQKAHQVEQKTMATFSGEIESALLSTYSETRITSDEASKFRQWILDHFRWFRGRKDKLTLPSTGVFGKLKHLHRNLIYGGYYRADFIIGFSISDRVNFEIWYTQDVNPYSKEMKGTFSVYDVNSKRLVRGGIKYYRQAALVAKEKLASPEVSNKKG